MFALLVADGVDCAPKATHRMWLLASTWIPTHRADSRFALSQWETALPCNDVSHWLGANLDSDLYTGHWYLGTGLGAPITQSVKMCVAVTKKMVYCKNNMLWVCSFKKMSEKIFVKKDRFSLMSFLLESNLYETWLFDELLRVTVLPTCNE